MPHAILAAEGEPADLRDVEGAERTAEGVERDDGLAPLELRRAEFRAAVRQRAAVVAGEGEAGAVERMGLQPRLVAGSRENIKVTFPEDLKIAEAILANRRGDPGQP